MIDMHKRILFRSVSLILCLFCIISIAKPQISAQKPQNGSGYRSIQTDGMQIALTFDDGPHPTQTPKILEILERYKVKATFFMIGVNVVNYPHVARAVLRGGHEVGNHTYSHYHIKELGSSALESELGKCEDALEELCEYRPHLLRPPEGMVTQDVKTYSEKGDYALILWSLDTRDWEHRSATEIADSVLSQVKPGDIILMHDYVGRESNTPHALEILLPELLSRGYEPVTVSQLLKIR